MSQTLHIFEIVSRAGIENDPKRALEDLIEDCISRTSASDGTLYLLNLSEAAYVQFIGPDQKAVSRTVISLLPTQSNNNDPALRQAIGSKKIVRIRNVSENQRIEQQTAAQSRLIVPIVREGKCLG